MWDSYLDQLVEANEASLASRRSDRVMSDIQESKHDLLEELKQKIEELEDEKKELIAEYHDELAEYEDEYGGCEFRRFDN